MKRILPLPIEFLKQLWRFFTEPFETLPKSEDRRLAIISAAFLFLSAIGVLLEQMVSGATPRIALILLSISYFAARTRWYRIAMSILLITLSFPSYLVALTIPNPDIQNIATAFIWIALPLILGSLVLSVRIVIGFSGVNVALIILLPYLRPELNFSMLGSSLGYYLMISIFVLTVMVQRNEIESDRQKELISSRKKLSQEIIERERFAVQAQRRADQLAMLNEVSVAISNLKELDNIFTLILEQVKQHFQLDVFFIALYNEKTGKLSFPLMFDDGKLWNEPEKELSKAVKIAQVLQTGEPLLWNRSAAEIIAAAQSDNRLGDSARVAASILITPLQVGEKAIGAISVQSYTAHAFGNEQSLLLSALAHQIVIALENARLFEETVKRTQRLAVLNEIGREISTISDLPSLMENVYQQVRKALSVDLFFIGLYDKSKNELAFPSMYDAGRKWEQPPSPVLESTFSGKTILTRKPLLINHWSGTANESESTLIIVGDDSRTTQALMFTPMLSGEETIGVLSVQSYDLNAYNEEDLNLLSGIANQVGIAIQNTRLLEETRQKAQQLSIVNEISQAVAALKDLPELLDIVLTQAQQKLNIDTFFVGLYDHSKNEITYPIMYDDGKRYSSSPDTLSEGSFLFKLLHGEKAKLINRTPEELAVTPTTVGMLGNTSKLSASLIVVPLTLGDQIIGVFSTQSYTLNAYDESDLNLFIRIANQVSIAIENSRLYTSAQQEIAERQKAEEQLRSAEAKYRELVERVPAVIYSSETGATGRWFYVSPQIEALLGFTPDEWIAN